MRAEEPAALPRRRWRLQLHVWRTPSRLRSAILIARVPLLATAQRHQLTTGRVAVQDQVVLAQVDLDLLALEVARLVQVADHQAPRRHRPRGRKTLPGGSDLPRPE